MIQLISNLAQNYYLLTQAEFTLILYGVAFFSWIVCFISDTIFIILENSRRQKFKNQLPPSEYTQLIWFERKYDEWKRKR